MNEATAPRAGRRAWIGLAVLVLPTLLIAVDFTVLHLAVPHLSADLQPSSAQLLWIVDIYGFLIAGSLITMGTLGDRIGRRRLLLTGAAAFGAASVLAAFATSAELLIAARALLGVAGATLMPSTQALLRTMFPDPGQRTVAIGVWASGFSVGSALGPLLGGALLERFWWGSVFLVGVPVMAALLVVGPLLLPEDRDPTPGRFDLISAALSLVGVLLVVFGVKRIAEDGLGWLPNLAIAAGLVVGAAFLRRQRALPDPLLDLGLFANRVFSAALGTNALLFFVQFGFALFTAQYLQLVLGLSPLEAGLWTVPSALAFIVGSNLAPKIVRRTRPVSVIAAGLAITAVGCAMLTRADLNSLGLVVAASVVNAVGLGLATTLTLDLILGAVPPERAGAAVAISETGIELGGALGIAVLGSVGTAVYRGATADAIPAGVPPAASATARDTLGGALAVAGELPGQVGAALLGAAREGFVQGLHLVAVTSAALLVGLAVLVMALLRRAPAVPSLEGPPISAPEARPATSSFRRDDVDEGSPARRARARRRRSPAELG